MRPRLMMDNATEIMGYVDFKLGVDTEPDQNGCMWVELATMRSTMNGTFDIAADDVRLLRAACDTFLRKVEENCDHLWEPTDTQGHEMECTLCGKQWRLHDEE